jgi:acyl-CoA synthetase (NDP forming)
MPVAVKSAAAGAHKTESGGVALDLRDTAAVRAAAERIGGVVIVQPMLEGAELLTGITRDPLFGPLVAIGLGGIQAELLGSVGFGLAPLTDVDVDELLASGPLARLAVGFRGRPRLDSGAIADLLHRLSALALDIPEIAELDLNPVLATERGVVAVDRRIRLRAPAPSARTKTW